LKAVSNWACWTSGMLKEGEAEATEGRGNVVGAADEPVQFPVAGGCGDARAGCCRGNVAPA